MENTENTIVCEKCGEKSSSSCTFCPNCGNKLIKEKVELAKEGIDLTKENIDITEQGEDFTSDGDRKNYSANNINRDDMDLFISKNVYYYKENFEKINVTGNKKTWNWAAFFLGINWFLYRKMYIQTAKLLLASIAIGVISAIIPYSSILLGLGLSIVVGMYGNSVYLDHVNSKLDEINRMGYKYKESEIIRKGGTNLAIPIIIAVVQLIIAIAIPIFIFAMFSSVYYY